MREGGRKRRMERGKKKEKGGEREEEREGGREEEREKGNRKEEREETEGRRKKERVKKEEKNKGQEKERDGNENGKKTQCRLVYFKNTLTNLAETQAPPREPRETLYVVVSLHKNENYVASSRINPEAFAAGEMYAH